MAAFEIPLRPQSEQFGIALAGVSYTLTVTWRATTWFLDVALVNGARLLSGVPLVTGGDILAQYPDVGIAGRMYVVTDHSPDTQPTYAGLGSSSHLYFVSP